MRDYIVRLGAQESVGTRHLDLAIGKSIIIELPRDASEIFVGNPKVASAVIRSARRLYLIAAEVGQTTIFAMDKDGQRIASLDLSVGRDLDELRRILSAAVPGNDVRVSAINDNVVLTGSVADAAEAQKVADIANAFVGTTAYGSGAGGSGTGGTGSSAAAASNSSISLGGAQIVSGKVVNAVIIRGKDQVMLRVTVAEVQRSIIKQLGISTDISNGGSSAGAWNNLAGTGAGGLVAKITAGGTTLKVNMDALEQTGVARVLAEPTVTAVSGQVATFQAGGQISVPTSSSTDSSGRCTASYAQKDYGVSLNFLPTVLSEGRISLQIQTSVSDIDVSSAYNKSDSCATMFPGLRTRSNTTTVELPSGGSLVSAGLIQQTSEQVIRGMPGLMNIPVLGTLFRSRNYQRRDTELLIIVTPYIAKTLRPEQIAKPTDGFVDAQDSQSMFLGRVNEVYASPGGGGVQNLRGRVGFIHD
jgi:pilus assembly protein CpaC